ncbi:MAG: MarR family transcriptional regulator [Candidatus Omnitrophota bacterium]
MMASIEQEAKEMSVLVPKLMTGVKGSLMLSEDVTPQQMITIFTINEIDGCKVSVVSKRMGISAPTITGLVDRLVKNAYVQRVRDTQDRRIVFVKLTKKGKIFVGKFKKSIQKRWKQILVHLTDEERADYIRILKKLMQAFEEEKAKNA